MEAKKGIKESVEILEGFKAVGVPIAKTFADGEINGKDIPNAVELVKNYQVIIDAIDNAGDVIGEAKDYDQSELAIIGLKAVEVIKAIKDAKNNDASNKIVG